MGKIRIGVSACLLGEKVRYDGGHKHDRYITDVLGEYFDFAPICPETESGMGIPREAMRLEGDPDDQRLITNKTRVDMTDQMNSFIEQALPRLEALELCGFIFKKDSPSSGLFRVKVYHGASADRTGSGLFAAAFVKRFPMVPAEEEGRLNDPAIRDNFITRVFAFRRVKDLIAAKPSIGGLVAFHTAQKLLMMAHSIPHYRSMGSLVAHAKEMKRSELFSRYEAMYMEALLERATAKKNANVLMHAAGYFKQDLDAAEKQELIDIIERYRTGKVPLIVPITLLSHYIKKYRKDYLAGQVYFSPHPSELMLRNHV